MPLSHLEVSKLTFSFDRHRFFFASPATTCFRAAELASKMFFSSSFLVHSFKHLVPIVKHSATADSQLHRITPVLVTLGRNATIGIHFLSKEINN
jgi:hypothetical protein